MQRVRSQALAFVFSFLGSLISSTLAAQAAPQQPAAAAGGSGRRRGARLQGEAGNDLGPGAIRLAGRAPGDDNRPDLYELAWSPPRGLAPGKYRLALTVSRAGGAQTATSPFTIGLAPAAAAKSVQ
jgi:hypothetical protein